jgi:hypothetical protein
LLADAQAQADVEPEVAPELGEKRTLCEGGAAAAEVAFALLGVLGEERFGEHQLEDGIAEKLKALIAFGDVRIALEKRLVRDGPEQQFGIAERVAEALLQLIQG